MTLAEAVRREQLWDGDVLLFRGTGWIAWLIQLVGRTPYSHAAMVGWNGAPWCLETRELKGGRAVYLVNEVEANPGRIDVFRPVPEWGHDRDMSPAVKYMRKATGRTYGYQSLKRASLRHLPIVRWFVKPETDDLAIAKGPAFCSQLVDQALRQVIYRGKPIDPCPNHAGRITEPGDLARSADLEFQYTLSGVGL